MRSSLVYSGAGMNYRIENADINDDSANYGCVARNPLGDASATIKVEVICKLSSPLFLLYLSTFA